ncbi:hypothetical protein EXU57_17190 [Segetibacter sp. 3557_3]|uniref:hypothetical protein n=1 Tax=Segetibacter sp. 3557_3 TaxID=2547429 RepID=UPI001058880E|nr:hypothetical protein [Segetibacter sp. 3557_3]TDH23536.1 hypothetical protein EXU57_17190 [Segetibacter sp. 3557_3]
MIEKIVEGDAIVAIILRATYNNKGIEFFTPLTFSQQLGYMNRPRGYVVQPHIHRVIERKLTSTEEVLYIKSGTVKIRLFDTQHVFIADRILHTGDVILLANCCHGIEVIEDAEIIEVTQGPSLEVNEKRRVRQTQSVTA